MKRGKWRLVNPSFDCLVYTFINMLCRIKQDVHIAKRITKKLRIYNCLHSYRYVSGKKNWYSYRWINEL